MAAQGAMAEAEAAFQLAAQIPVKGGHYLDEVLALRDLKVLVLDKDERGVHIHSTTYPPLVDAAGDATRDGGCMELSTGAEGSMQLKTAIQRLMGVNIADEAQLAELAIVLGDRIDLQELLK